MEAPADCAHRVQKTFKHKDPEESADFWVLLWSEYLRGLENYGRHGWVLGEVARPLLISP